MRIGVVCVLAVVLGCAVVVTAPVEAIDREHIQGLKKDARVAMLEMRGETAAEQTKKGSKTVSVRCDKGQSVQAALDNNPGPVTIEIQGICAENVRIERRNDVTLIGKSGDPALDGLQGVDQSSTRVFTLEVWYSEGVVLEGLSFSNAMSGAILGYSNAKVVNCHFNDNSFVGLRLDRSAVNEYMEIGEVTNLQASRNGAYGIDLRNGSTLQCQTCEMHENGSFGAFVLGGSFATFWNSGITGARGILARGVGSYVDIDCVYGIEPEHPCSLIGTFRAGQGINGGDVAALGASVEGPFRAENDGASAALVNSQLTGKMYARDGSLFILDSQQISGNVMLEGRSEFTVSGELDDTGNIVIASTFGPATLTDWTRATFDPGTVITNPVQCFDAADALNKGAVVEDTGAVDDCPHWTP